MNHTRFLFASLLALILLACAGGPLIWGTNPEHGDWSQFRGAPHGSGYAPWGIDPPLELIWTRKLRGSVRASPLAVGETTIVSTLGGTIYFLDAHTGRSIGEHRTRGSFSGTPALSNDLLLFCEVRKRSSLTALDLMSGDQVWKRRSVAILSPMAAGGDTLFAGTERGGLLAIETRTGEELWRFEAEDGIRSSPVLWGKAVLFGSDDDHLYALSRETGALIWKADCGASITSSPAVDSVGVYVGTADGTLHARDRTSGEALWSFPTGGAIHSSPVYADTAIYFGSSDRSLYALDRRSGDLLWAFEARGVIVGAPALTKHTVYAGSADRSLYALARDSGEMAWRYETEAAIRSSPALGQEGLYVGTVAGIVYAFGPQPSLDKEED